MATNLSNSSMSRLFWTIDPLIVIVDFPRPNIGSQANVDPTYAASLWQQHMQPLWGQGIKCISPSVTTDDTGFNWLQTFTKACSGCSVRFYYVHSHRLVLMNNL